MVMPRLRSWVRTPVPPAPMPEFLALTAVESTGSYTWYPHQHPQSELIIAHTPYRALVNDVEVALEAGDALLLGPDDWHEDRLRRGTRYTAVWFRLAGAAGLFVPGAPAHARVAHGVGEALAPHLALLTAGEPAARLQDPAMAAILWTVLGRLPPEMLQPPFVSAVEDAERQALVACLERNLERPLAVTALADELGWSARTLTRRCRTLLGGAPAKVQATMRLERAAQFLAHSTLSVQQVADALGYANAFHFSRVFARQYGKPPSLWRQSARDHSR